MRTSQVKSSQDTYTRYERDRFTPQVQSLFTMFAAYALGPVIRFRTDEARMPDS